MNKYLLISILFLFVIGSCTSGLGQDYKLNAKEFSDKIDKTENTIILDVRTPNEYANERINRSVNIDWNSTDFEKQVSGLNKSSNYFVYCLSGGRSSSAANKMRAMGFNNVYELNGGILKWKAEKHPVIGNKNNNKGMSVKEFEISLSQDKINLVDFYAEWCIPCKKMEPYLKEISEDMSDKVHVIRINIEEHPALFNNLKLDAVPVLQIYRNQKLTWQHKGFISKEDVLKQL